MVDSRGTPWKFDRDLQVVRRGMGAADPLLGKGAGKVPCAQWVTCKKNANPAGAPGWRTIRILRVVRRQWVSVAPRQKSYWVEGADRESKSYIHLVSLGHAIPERSVMGRGTISSHTRSSLPSGSPSGASIRQ